MAAQKNDLVEGLCKRVEQARAESRRRGKGLSCEVRICARMARECSEYSGCSTLYIGLDLARRSGTTFLPPPMKDVYGQVVNPDDVLCFRIMALPSYAADLKF